MDLGFLFYFFVFLLAIFLSFFVPGNTFVAALPLNRVQKVTLSITFGIVLWALQGFLFGFLHMRFLTYVYLLGFLIVWLWQNWSKLTPQLVSFPKPTLKSSLFVGFIIVAVVSQLTTTFATGISTSKGIYFCCGLPDSLFHIALTNELVTQFPPREPGISGELLHNYHFLPNLVNADLIRVFHLPLLYLQYPYTSILVTVLLALNLLVFAQLSIRNQSFAYWLVFFVFFSGDILYLLTFIQLRGINFNTTFLENASWLWISPPRVYAAALFFGGLSFLYLWLQKTRQIILGILVAVTLGSLIGFKVYFGIFSLVGLAALLPFFLRDKAIDRVLVIISAFFISVCLYLPINSGAGGLVFTGFWRFNDFAANSIFGLQRMELARYVYLAHGNWGHALFNSLIYFVIYFVFIFGTLLLSLFQTKRSLSLLSKELHIFLISGLIACFILGSFFIQKTGGANSSQFLITDMIIISVYAALAAYYWLRKVKSNKLLVLLLTLAIVGLTIPRVIYENSIYLHRVLTERGFILETNELAALNYLRTNSKQNAVVLQSRVNDCMYITFMAQRQTYVCLDGAPTDRGVSVTKRLKVESDIVTDNDFRMIPPNVTYLYLPTGQYTTKKKLYEKYGFKTVLSNSEVTLLQIH